MRLYADWHLADCVIVLRAQDHDLGLDQATIEALCSAATGC